MADISTGTVSSRGQIAIPQKMREKMHLKDGETVLFYLSGDTLMVKKASSMSWDEVTAPLVAAKKKIREDQVNEYIHQLRKSKK